MSALAKVLYFGSSATRGMRRAPFVHVVAVLVIALALFCAGLARAATRWVEGLISTLGGEVELTVYLDSGATEQTAQELAGVLSKRLGTQAKVIDPDSALRRLREDLGEAGEALEGLTNNTLPWSVEVTVAPQWRTPAALKELAQAARKAPGVSAVDYAEAAVERLDSLSRALRFGGMILFLVVAVIAITVVSATLQLAIYARREEIEIQKLVGATSVFVRAPFLIEGLLQGALGAGLALLALWALFRLAGPAFASNFAFLTGPREVALLDLRLAMEISGVGALLGLLGSLLAVGRFMRV